MVSLARNPRMELNFKKDSKDLKEIRGNYTPDNKRKITGMVFMLRELESMIIPIFSEWWKYFKK